jgi:S1-C subfamily serine protease
LIEIGDIIVQVGETPIDTEADLFKALETFKPGDRVKITVSRLEPSGDTFKSKELVLTVQLKASDSLPASMSFQDGYP